MFFVGVFDFFFSEVGVVDLAFCKFFGFLGVVVKEGKVFGYVFGFVRGFYL